MASTAAPASAMTTTSLELKLPDFTFAMASSSSVGAFCVVCPCAKRGRSGHPRTKHRAILRTKCGSSCELDLLALIGNHPYRPFGGLSLNKARGQLASRRQIGKGSGRTLLRFVSQHPIHV